MQHALQRLWVNRRPVQFCRPLCLAMFLRCRHKGKNLLPPIYGRLIAQMLICPLFKSTSFHLSPKSSLWRRPVVASIKIKTRCNGPTPPRSCRISSTSRMRGIVRRLAALTNGLDGLAVKEFVSASTVIQHAQDVPDFRARRARQWKLPQPQLHLNRLYPAEWILPPPWHDFQRLR